MIEQENTKMTINQFRNEFKFLSNFYEHPICKNGIVYPTVEHYFQAHKTKDKETHLNIAYQKWPAGAKKTGRRCILRSDWEQIKEDVMYEALELKFRPDSSLSEMLLATEPATLVEGNWWGDRVWGIDLITKEGKNRLGVLLMRLRNKLKLSQTSNKNRTTTPISNAMQADDKYQTEQISFLHKDHCRSLKKVDKDLVKSHKRVFGKQSYCFTGSEFRYWVWDFVEWRIFVNNKKGLGFEVNPDLTSSEAFQYLKNYMLSMS